MSQPNIDMAEAEKTRVAILSNLFVPEFVKQCSAHGIELRTPEQVESALKIASKLALYNKQAAAVSADPLSRVMRFADQQLDGQLKSAGLSFNTPPQQPLTVDANVVKLLEAATKINQAA